MVQDEIVCSWMYRVVAFGNRLDSQRGSFFQKTACYFLMFLCTAGELRMEIDPSI